MEYGLWSLLPPLLAIVLAMWTREVYTSLLLGIFAGCVLIAEGNLWQGFLESVQSLVTVFQDEGNTRTIMFCILVGALIVLMQRSGGVSGFIEKIQKILLRYAGEQSERARQIVQFFAWTTGVLIFVETSISALTVGTLYRPIFDKMGISREKLAYITDSSSSPASILIPLNGWGAFIMGLLAAAGFAQPLDMMLRAMWFNFYPMFALLLVPLVIFIKKDFKKMAAAEKRTRETGKVWNEGALPMVADDLTSIEALPNVPHRARNMVVPIAVMILMMPIMLIYTGWESAMTALPTADFFEKINYAIGKGSGSVAVLVAVIVSLFATMAFYRWQGLMPMREMIDLSIKGIAGLLPLGLLMLLAFAIGAVCKQLGTGVYVASIVSDAIPSGFVPLLIFILSCFIAFSTGTSWGTFAIMIPIATPIAATLQLDPALIIAAVMGGGVFGDHCSPISDTTILSSMAAATDHIDHVKTQLPYALLAGGGAALLYLVLGFL